MKLIIDLIRIMGGLLVVVGTGLAVSDWLAPFLMLISLMVLVVGATSLTIVAMLLQRNDD